MYVISTLYPPHFFVLTSSVDYTYLCHTSPFADDSVCLSTLLQPYFYPTRSKTEPLHNYEACLVWIHNYYDTLVIMVLVYIRKITVAELKPFFVDRAVNLDVYVMLRRV